MAVAYKPKILETLAYAPNPKKGEMKRIGLLGRMNDRHIRALGAGDKAALFELAAEYMTLGNHGGCPTKAHQIMMEAEML